MLRSKSILAPKQDIDGLRISIMSRHTLSDGKTPDTRLLVDGLFDEHIPEFAAPAKLIGDYYKRGLPFDGPGGYGEQYIDYLETHQKDNVIAIIVMSSHKNVTVMCIEDTPEHCHRRLFIEYCKELSNKLGRILQTEIL